MKESIEINAAIFPKIMTMVLGKPIDKSKNEDIALKDLTISEPDLIIDLPRSAHVVYLQKIAAEHNDLELCLLRQYAYGQTFTDEDYSNLLDLILKPINRSWTQTISTNDVLSPFGLCIVKDEDNNRTLELIEDAIPSFVMTIRQLEALLYLRKNDIEKFNLVIGKIIEATTPNSEAMNFDAIFDNLSICQNPHVNDNLDYIKPILQHFAINFYDEK